MNSTSTDAADIAARGGSALGMADGFGVVTLLAGVAILAWPGPTVLVVALALLLGIYWIVNGTIEIFAALSQPGGQGRGWAMFMGVVSIVAGLIALVSPAISLLALAVVLGVWRVVFGALEMVSAFRLLRSEPKTRPRMAHAM